VILGAKDVFCRYPVRLPDINGKGSRKVDSYRIIIDEIQRLGGYWNSEAIITQQQFEALKAENTYKNKNGEKNKWKSKS
jgi:hypothetical protein